MCYAERINIIQNGTTDYAIVVPDICSIVEEKAALEIQTYLCKVTGTTLKIVPEKLNTGNGIYVGHTEYARQNNVLGESKENWRIKVVDNKVILTGGLGADDRGVIYAAYHFLEDYVGIRWWNQWEEYIPVCNSFSMDIDVDVNKTPAFEYRKIIDIFSHIDYTGQASNRLNVVGDDGRPDGAYNKELPSLGGVMQMGPPHHVHTVGRYFPADEYFEKHPEWWSWNRALQKHVPYGQFCLNNEGFYQAMLEKLMENIKKTYEEADAKGVERPCFYSISLNDTG